MKFEEIMKMFKDLNREIPYIFEDCPLNHLHNTTYFIDNLHNPALNVKNNKDGSIDIMSVDGTIDIQLTNVTIIEWFFAFYEEGITIKEMKSKIKNRMSEIEEDSNETCNY